MHAMLDVLRTIIGLCYMLVETLPTFGGRTILVEEHLRWVATRTVSAPRALTSQSGRPLRADEEE